MASYKITVKVNRAWIDKFNENDVKLCFASCVDSNQKSKFNVVASADTVADKIDIEWEEHYQIAASKSKFDDGAKFTTSTEGQDIKFGESFRIDNSWLTNPPNPDKEAPKAGFLFRNDTISSAVVYKKVNGKPTAVYFSAAGPLPPGIENLEPKAKAKIWFSSSHDTGSMVSTFISRYMDLDLTGRTEATVTYDASGIWNRL